ncbi:hypothetical protein KFE98_15625 [bacterium SCSIO 12741]|nr:hypothetical protein KFE98_15625 [bacterium SCSIO 12741]
MAISAHSNMFNWLKNNPLLSLILSGLLAGLIWRLEVEYHGWAGLKWISYFHYSIPAGILLFFVWSNAQIQLTAKKRLFFNLSGLVFTVVVLGLLELSLRGAFISGPSAFIHHMTAPRWLLFASQYGILILLPLIPIGLFFMIRLFGMRPPYRNLFFSLAGLVVSVPICVLLLDLVNHRGGADEIHALKSGFIVPFWFFFLGILFYQSITNRSSSAA